MENAYSLLFKWKEAKQIMNYLLRFNAHNVNYSQNVFLFLSAKQKKKQKASYKKTQYIK